MGGGREGGRESEDTQDGMRIVNGNDYYNLPIQLILISCACSKKISHQPEYV